MRILKEDIKGVSDFALEGDLNFTGVDTGDLLVESIDECEFSAQSLLLEDDMILLKLQVNSNITYLDARTLEKIKMDINFEEDIPFSFNKNHSKEMDIDYFEDELDLSQLVFELIMVNVPFNYSKSSNEDVLKEDSFYEENNQPFAKIFEEKE